MTDEQAAEQRQRAILVDATPALLSEVERLRTDLELTETQLANANRTIDRWEADYKQQRTRAEKAESEVERLGTENGRLIVLLHDMRRRAEGAEAEITRLLDVVLALRQGQSATRAEQATGDQAEMDAEEETVRLAINSTSRASQATGGEGE